MNEGQRVQYIGAPGEGLTPGESVMLLAHSGASSAHVRTASTGAIYLVDLDDLAPLSRRSSRPTDPLVDDSLEVGGLSSFAVREVYEEQGESGVLNVMSQLGHLSGFAQIAEEALTLVAARVRQDPSFREVLASLSPEEGESLVRIAVGCLVRDAFDLEDDL